jgi:hypothetical protein
MKGDQALMTAFKKGRYNAVATDDAKLSRILKAAGIRVVLPALLIYAVYKEGLIDRETSLNWLSRLAPFISEDEYSMTRIILEERP